MQLKASYMKEITQEYEQIRFRNQQLLNSRIEEVRAHIPRIAEIDATIRDINIDAALASLHDEEVDAAALEAQTQALIDEKYTLLVQSGYPEDYLAPIYTCGKCKDTGYVEQQPCECFKQKIVQRQYKNSNLGSNVTNDNFQNFCFEYYSVQPDGIHELSPRDNITNVYQSLLKYTRGIDAYFHGDTNIKGNILFHGNTGVGKTFLSRCVAKELLDSGYAVLYVSANTLFQMISDVVMNKNQIPGSQDFQYSLNQCDFLIIDDLGTEYANSFTASSFYSLINDRLLQRKATIISTNLSLAEIRERYSERIFSRICENYLIYNIYGEDIRFVKRKQWQQ